jgi:hypothetical protein
MTKDGRGREHLEPGCEGLQVPAGPRRGRIVALVKHGDTPRSYRPYPETQSADKPTTSMVRKGAAGA